jgi:hypothetical protein
MSSIKVVSLGIESVDRLPVEAELDDLRAVARCCPIPAVRNPRRDRLSWVKLKVDQVNLQPIAFW